MAISLPRSLVEFILLGPTNDRRQLQDSPILGDVWIAYGNDPDGAVELLITPDREEPAGAVAIAIDKKLKHRVAPTPNIAPLHNIVAARLKFEDVFRVVMPMTKWWHEKQIQSQYESFKNLAENPDRLNDVITAVVKLARQWSTKEDSTREINFAAELLPAFDRYVALSGLVLWAANKKPRKGKEFTKDEMLAELGKVPNQGIHDEVQKCLAWIEKSGASDTLVFQISRNRPAMPAVARSVPAVKADAARTLFKVNCSKLAWAVIDAGIKGDHDAFKDAKGVSRVKRAFDFSRIRKIVSLDNLRPSAKTVDRIKDLLSDDLLQKPTRRDAELMLKRLADDASNRRPIHWDLVRPFVEIKPETRPTSDHGTHVAGIIGANKDGGLAPPTAAGTGKGKGKKPVVITDRGDFADGMCPDIQLYDFRVLSSDVIETEFAIIAALQFIRYLNARTDYMTIHGANLSLSIPHDVRNYACGRTPVCIECERLVDSGVVVVAAAGNLGYQSFNTRDGSYEGYAAFSITDPGNADGVLTVGSTHRYAPHTYGVSFFSSRGPTGDGRLKPDLVAPGERIKGPYREGWGDLDGTSMAAPHVSGAAAMLMARNTELVGQPRRIKQVLCKSATDLGRETSFQGNGMLDVLRAFQEYLSEDTMIFSLDVRRARKGDCLLLHYGTKTKPRLMLIDGGPSDVYKPHLEPRIQEIRKKRKLTDNDSLTVDHMMVSHVDDDHIRGLIDLTGEEIDRLDAHDPLLLNVLNLWHNSFDAVIDHTPDELTASITKQFGAAAAKGAGLDDAKVKAIEGKSNEDTEVVRSSLQVLASIEQGFRLRGNAKKLGYSSNSEFGGKLIMATKNNAAIDLGGSLEFTVVGPMQPELKKLHEKHQDWLKEMKKKGTPVESALAAYVDRSVPNLSSVVVLAEVGGKRMLLTGDARGDKVLKGLEFTGLVKKGGTLEVDLLKVPHHGSSNNLDDDFFERVVADHYVFSGNGEHGNPERESLEMLFKARGKKPFTVHLTYPIAEIDVEREKDWDKERAKEQDRKKTKPKTKVRAKWSAEKNSLESFFDDLKLAKGQKIRIVHKKNPHVINLLDAF